MSGYYEEKQLSILCCCWTTSKVDVASGRCTVYTIQYTVRAGGKSNSILTPLGYSLWSESGEVNDSWSLILPGTEGVILILRDLCVLEKCNNWILDMWTVERASIFRLWSCWITITSSKSVYLSLDCYDLMQIVGVAGYNFGLLKFLKGRSLFDSSTPARE